MNKEFPPYSVIAGIPAKIIGVKFSKDEIISHERSLYSQSERLSEDYLSELFETVYKDKKVITHVDLSDENVEYLKRELKNEGLIYPEKNWEEL